MARRDQQQQGQQVAILQPPRMQMPEHVAERYGLNDDTWRALTDAVFPLAKTVGAVLLALAYCDRNRLDVFQRPVHIVPMRVGNRTVETVWPGIGQIRIVAQRQEAFAGYDDCEFGEDKTTTFNGKIQLWDNGQRSGTQDIEATVTYPEWARFVVYKMLHGERTRLPGPKVWFTETFASRSHMGGDVPNEKWTRSPRQMLEKCAEAAAYRRAFPDVLGNEMAAEEMEGRRLDPDGAIDAEYVEVDDGKGGQAGDGAPKKAAPKRGDFQQQGGRTKPDPEPAAEEVEHGDPPEQELEGEREYHEARKRADRLLDGQDMPDSEEGWAEYERMLAERLQRLPTVEAVDAEQERQQFRLDAADLPTQQRLYAMFAEVSADLPSEADLPPAGEQGDLLGGKDR